MNLKSFGCSFIFGSELPDNMAAVARGEKIARVSQMTWPAHLATHLGRTYNCYARPGSGNLQILERILNQTVVSDNADLFVIGWSWIDRFDYYDPNYNQFVKTTPWCTIMPIDDSELAKIYYKELHTEYRDKFTCLSYIKLAIDTLKQKDIPFIMTYIDELLFDQTWHTSLAVTQLQEYVRPYMTTFEGKTFLEWSRHNGYPETLSWHPLEQAHQSAGDYIIQAFDTKSIGAHCRLS